MAFVDVAVEFAEIPLPELMRMAGQVVHQPDPDLKEAPAFDLSLRPASEAFQRSVEGQLADEVADTAACANMPPAVASSQGLPMIGKLLACQSSSVRISPPGGCV